jgi:prevent-host-death family protein
MERVGVRDLKQNASRVLARVKAGETVEVTERGVPVARLVPVPAPSEYERMVAAGDILLGNQRLAELLPIEVRSGARLSDELADLRDDRR